MGTGMAEPSNAIQFGKTVVLQTLPVPSQSTVGTTTGKARYVKRPASAEELYVYLDGPRDGPGSNLQHVEVDVQIADLRQRQSAPTLDRNGFQLETLHVDVDIEWDNDAEVIRRASTVLSTQFPVIQDALLGPASRCAMD